MTTPCSDLKVQAQRLGLHGLLAHWNEVASLPWVTTLLTYEEDERQRRSLERRIRNAHLARFKPMADFDWSWPRKIDRELVQDLFCFGFLDDGDNIILMGPNGVGKSMIAHNLAHQALLRGFTVLFTTASALLSDLAGRDSARALQQRIHHYASPRLLCIDEVGYLSYDNRHADLLFEVINRRYGKLPTLITTNKPFSEWNEVFPNAACVVTLIDRLVHHAELVQIEADSYRLKEAKERATEKAKARCQRRKHPSS